MKRVFFVVLLALGSAASAAELGDLRDIPSDLWGSVKEEVRPESFFPLAAAGGAAAFTRYGGTRDFDDYRVDAALTRSAPLGKRATDFGAVVGYPLYLMPAVGAVYFAGRSLGSSPAREFGLAGFEALALAGVETEILKFSVKRVRPDSTDLAAFPSGHTSASFALATVAADEWGWKAGVPSYLAASFVGYSRMEGHKHYLSDVLFGAGLGIVCGWSVVRVRRRAHPRRYAYEPFILPGGGGVAVHFE